MLKEFIACAPENFLKGRKSFKPEAIVLHTMSALERADGLFLDPDSAMSAHYVVGLEGSAHQYVEETDSAFHAGIVVNPTWRGIKPGVNPNFYTIGVAGAGEWTDALHDRMAELIFDIAHRWNIPLDAEHLPVHSEIRASKTCPGDALDRAKLLARLATLQIQAQAASGSANQRMTVSLISNTNLREGAPRTMARIVRTLPAGEDVDTIGFTDAGDRVQGNNIWYQTADNNYLWAGNTDAPQPAREAPAPAPLPSPPATSDSVAGCGIALIDALLGGQTAQTITADEPDHQATGAIQDLLAGHGFRGMPGILSASYGSFGANTLAAIKAFQAAQQLPAVGAVDAPTLQKLVSAPAVDPRITQVYLTLVLKTPFAGMQKILAITAQMEGVGKFGAINLNTDKAGLSYGLIQWAQRPGRLPELLRAFRLAGDDLFVRIFAGGDSAMADGLIRHVSKPTGGVDPKTGVTLDPKFDLVEAPWVDRFKLAAMQTTFQLAQVDTAMRAFEKSYRFILGYADDIKTERGCAFMLDVANQFGDGGLKRIYSKVWRDGMNEQDLLTAIADETVEEMPDKFQQGVRARRDGFLHTALLLDRPVALPT